MLARLVALLAVALVAAACSSADQTTANANPDTLAPASTEAPAAAENTAGDVAADEPTVAAEPTAMPPPTPSPTVAPLADVSGTVVSAVDGRPLPAAEVSAGKVSALTDATGSFALVDVTPGTELSVRRPAWLSSVAPWPDSSTDVTLELEPLTVKALRVSREVAADPDRFEELLQLADDTVVNALVFDTKDEGDRVLYETNVEFAHEIGAVDPVYDPVGLLEQARARGLYAVTRIVTFEDPVWAQAVPDASLTGSWVDAANRNNWTYPLDLAVEACDLGFDEVQFDYVRFPSGEAAARARSLVPATEAERAEAIGSFLAEARARLHERGCGVSAAIFGIVMSSETDERLGQTPESISASVDAISPMLYPSHYSPGWLGFADPNDHPGPVIAYALDQGADRIADGSLVRPWIQGFYYNGAQVQAQINEADARGAGWIIWNVFGEYRRDWLPAS